MVDLNIFNADLVTEVDPTFDISFTDIVNAYKEVFSDYDVGNINIIFVKREYINELNKEYRNIDAPTDVLSFEIENGISEIYICPEFVYDSFQGDGYEEEILRLIIHGTLHILGYDHLQSMNDNPKEDMFILQEELLLKLKKLCS